MTKDACEKCGHKFTNGNSLKKDIQHQSEVGELIHERLANETSRLDKDSKGRFEKNEEANTRLNTKINEVDSRLNTKVDGKYRWLFTTMLSVIGILAVFIMGMNDANVTRIDQLETRVYELQAIVYQDTALLEAIVSSNVAIQP